jgi:hypothetical protein
MQKDCDLSPPVEDNRSRPLRRAPVSSWNSLFDETSAEVRIDQASFGLLDCLFAILVSDTVAEMTSGDTDT